MQPAVVAVSRARRGAGTLRSDARLPSSEGAAVGLFDVVGPGPVDFGLPSVVSGFGGDRRGLIESAVVSLGGVGPHIGGMAAPSSPAEPVAHLGVLAHPTSGPVPTTVLNDDVNEAVQRLLGGTLE